jgi:hypothetical protein
MLSKLTKSHRIIGPSAGVSLLAFFLPWVLVSCEGQPVASFSGFQLAFGGAVNTQMGVIPVNASFDLLLLLAGVVAILVMIFMVYQGRMLAARTMRFITIIVGVNALILLWRALTAGASASAQGGPTVEVSLQLGYWITLLAHGAMGYALWQDRRDRKSAAATPEGPLMPADPPGLNTNPPAPPAPDISPPPLQPLPAGTPTIVLGDDEQQKTDNRE